MDFKMNDKDIEKLLQQMADLIELRSTKISLDSFADKSKSGFDIYNNTIVPNITMLEYLRRFNWYLSRGLEDPELSIKHLILAMNFVDRFIQNNPGFQLTDLNCHRLVCVAVLLAHKVLLDSCYNNTFFAVLGGLGLGTDSINQLELDFANKMGFTFKIDPGEFAAKAVSLGLTELQVVEMLAVDANGMTKEEIMGAIPEERLSKTSKHRI